MKTLKRIGCTGLAIAIVLLICGCEQKPQLIAEETPPAANKQTQISTRLPEEQTQVSNEKHEEQTEKPDTEIEMTTPSTDTPADTPSVPETPNQTPQTTPEKPTTPTKPSDDTSAHTHSYEPSIVAPTCTEGGYTRYTCSCGASYKGDKSFALSHLYGNWETVVRPTVSSAGTRQCVCTRCGHINSEEVPPLDAETAEKYENYVDPRIEIRKNASGAVSYYYYPVAVVDTRTWGDPPYIQIANGGFIITYCRPDGSIVTVTVVPVEDHVHQCVIWEDGSYEFALFGNYDD